MADSLYQTDFALWAVETANALRERRFEELDIKHLAEEVEALASEDLRELRSRLMILLTHLLKWHFQSVDRSENWQATINIQRIDIEGILGGSPSLLPRVLLPTVYARAKRAAEMESMLGAGAFPNHCPYTLDQVLDYDFWPEA